MTFEEFERRKTIDDYSKYHESNHAYLGELIEKLSDHEVEGLVLKLREYIRDEADFCQVVISMSDPFKVAANARKKDLERDYKNGWSYPVVAA